MKRAEVREYNENKGILRNDERIENSNRIIFKFSLINYSFFLFVVLVKYAFFGKKPWDLLLLICIAMADFVQLVFYKKMRVSCCYGRLTMLVAAILFTVVNVGFEGSIILMLLLPTILMCILYMNRTFLNIMYGVWTVNAAICLIQMLMQENLPAQLWRDYFIVICICVMFGVSAYMVNSSVSLQYAYICNNLKKENNRTKKIYEESIVDSTTGLLNRNAYNAYIERYDKQKFKSMSCIYIDVNGLHEYNNTYGHHAGDKMLHLVAAEMKECFSTDMLYRIGGDEFVVLCEDCDYKSQMEELKKFQTQMKTKKIHIAAGMEWRDKDMDLDEMLKVADSKMYQDKKYFYKIHPCDRENGILYKKAVE